MQKIRIKLMSDLCAGNGESVGYSIDSDICADNYGFPYIPGKRILGCLRDSAVQLGIFGLQEADKNTIDEIFGNENGKEGKLSIGNATIPGIDSLHDYILDLKNDGKKDYLIRQSTSEKIMRCYSSVRGQTKIGSDGKAESGSLRFVRVLNQYDPITGKELEFVCQVNTNSLNDTERSLVVSACKTLHHIGLNRTRGLGNVLVIPEFDSDSSEASQITVQDHSTAHNENVLIKYHVEFESPITVQEYMENGAQIQARTMIGLFSRIYLKEHKEADEIFTKLFLDGTVKWSALTPVINGNISTPVPAMMMKLKNDRGKIENIYAAKDSEWKKKKPKSLDGYFASFDNDKRKIYISQPETQTDYHNRINEIENSDRAKKGLYMQESLKQGMVYGGYVILPKEFIGTIEKLLCAGQLKLGRSKKTQYGMATIKNISIEDYCPQTISVENDEPLVAILKSDLVLQNNAVFYTDNDHVRKEIAKAFDLNEEVVSEMNDICRYRVLTGYHGMWQMQKPKIQAIMGGSVYCFKAKKGDYKSEVIIGEYQQEGMGRIELMPVSKLAEMADASYGRISVKSGAEDKDKVAEFNHMLLYNAALAEIQEYAFRFKKKDDGLYYKQQILNDIPAGRIRQMLTESENLEELYKMIESMKISDVSSESVGKKAKSKDLIKAFYGEDRKSIDFAKMIEDKNILNEIHNTPDVLESLERSWKEPLQTLLHMIHYQKGRR